MSLLAKLGLPPLTKTGSGSATMPPPPTTAAPPTPPAKAKPAGKAAKNPKLAAPKGEVIEGEPTVVVELPLGQLVWANRTRKVWGFTNLEGELARGGPDWQDKDLAKMNALAEHAVKLVVQMQEWEETWRPDVFKVRQAAKDAAIGLAKVEKALPAMAERMASDPDFFREVNEYVKAEAAAKIFIGKIDTAQTELKSAAHALNSAVFKQKLDQAEGEQAAAAAALEQKKAEIKEAQEIFKTVFDVANKIITQDWKGLAEKALEYVGEKDIDAHYADDLAQLSDTLAAAKGKVKHFKTSALAEDLEKAREDLAAAAGRLKTVHEEFEAALDELGNQQANAQNELKESKQTAPVGQMIGERVKQIAAISAARSSCAVYARAADSAKAKLSKIAEEFGKIGSWLDQAAKTDPEFGRDTLYAKMIERCSRRNADLFWDWAATVPAAKRECEEAMKWLADTSDKGPMGDFEKARKATSKGLKKAK
jgi:hypothetical protein